MLLRLLPGPYAAAVACAGFGEAEGRTLRLTKATYARWRSERPFEGRGWFDSENDEPRYFNEVGNLLLVGRRKESPRRPRE